MPTSSKRSLEVEEQIPTELRPIYRQLVDEYEYLTKVHYGSGYVAYKVLADIVLAGWRPSEEPHPESKI